MSTQESGDSLPQALFADKSQRLTDVSIAFMVLLTVVFTLFVICKVKSPAAMSISTWVLMLLAYLCSLGLSILGILFVEIGGAGKSDSEYTSTIVRFLQIQTAAEFLYSIGTIFPRLAILVLYLNIFVSRWSRHATWAVFIFTVLLGVASVIWNLTVCQPIAFKWNKTIPGGKCGDILMGYRYFGIPNLVADVAIVILPIPTISRLQMGMSRKAQILVTFLVGSMGIITAVIKTVYFFKLDNVADIAYHSINVMTVGQIEPAAYFICACLPHLRPLLKLISITNVVDSCRSKCALLRGNGGGNREQTGKRHRRSVVYQAKVSDSEERAGFVELAEV